MLDQMGTANVQVTGSRQRLGQRTAEPVEDWRGHFDAPTPEPVTPAVLLASDLTGSEWWAAVEDAWWLVSAPDAGWVDVWTSTDRGPCPAAPGAATDPTWGLWRGTSTASTSPPLAWSTRPDVAVWFACRTARAIGGRPVVSVAWVPREGVIADLTAREGEVIVRPASVEVVARLTVPGDRGEWSAFADGDDSMPAGGLVVLDGGADS